MLNAVKIEQHQWGGLFGETAGDSIFLNYSCSCNTNFSTIVICDTHVQSKQNCTHDIEL